MEDPRLLHDGSFAVVTTDELKEYGLNNNDVCYVGGVQPFHEDPDDPYWLRMKMLVVRMKDGHILTDTNMLVVDPRNLEPVDDELQEKLHEILMEDFGDKDEDVSKVSGGETSH